MTVFRNTDGAFNRPGGSVQIDEVDLARAQEYALLANLLKREPGDDLLNRLAALAWDGNELGLAHAKLAQCAAQITPDAVSAEYFDLFGGLGTKGLLPYASYYITGSLYGRPLLRLRETFQELGLGQVEHDGEPEDHAATFCEFMAVTAGGEMAIPFSSQRDFFREQIAPWMSRFFADLEKSTDVPFYNDVGTVGRVFMEIERKGFELAGPG
ncbi:TorD/DmsD family molecular chaperone [Phyllobacterium endophyticum]|uniref:TorD/DmsD family molecular chaperone n=1 Tax=Phyllobacterium endophyticum TaxID=1149773 RepID=UPI0011CB3938|nr:molecular chaperone TorD family protein [Phyllobacterium endophyticum]TXR47005.1 molecular chaperone TorD family protein [Phyllobacterium endophyticum]